jgi:hypothetical protein
MTATLIKHDVDLMVEVADQIFDLSYDPEIQSDPEYKQDHLTEHQLSQLQKFCDGLDDIGITTAEQFMDRFYGAYTRERGMSPEAVFTEEIIDDYEIESWIVVDYQATWDCNLRHDYCTVEDFEDWTYFFTNT